MNDIRSLLAEAMQDFSSTDDKLKDTVDRARKRQYRAAAAALVTALAVAGAGIGVGVWAFEKAPQRPSGLAHTCTIGWQLFQVPNPGNDENRLSAVLAFTPRDAWAVGSYVRVPSAWVNRTLPPGSLGGPPPPALTTPLVLHWDGKSWIRVPAPNAHTSAGPTREGGTSLEDVAGVSTDDVWVVGGGQAPVIEHWDGREWTIVSSPNVNLVDATLTAVAAAAADDAWAVGAGGSRGIGPVIEHWDGHTWTVVPVRGAGTRYSALEDVFALSQNDAWAVGRDWDRALVLHWDGRRWNRVLTPKIRAPRLMGIAAISSNDVWAVGATYRDVDGNGPTYGLILHWNGRHWSEVSLPKSSLERWISAISATGPRDIWATGGSVGPSGAFRPILLHFDGASWTQIDLLRNLRSTSFQGVAALASGGPLVVGTDSSSQPSQIRLARACNR